MSSQVVSPVTLQTFPITGFRILTRLCTRFYLKCFVICQQLNEKGEAVGIGKFSHLLGSYVAVLWQTSQVPRGLKVLLFLACYTLLARGDSHKK